MYRLSSILAVLAAFTLFWAPASQAVSYNYTSFDLPGYTVGNITPWGISNSGQISGYGDINGANWGFLKDGNSVTLMQPPPVTPNLPSPVTRSGAMGISSGGAVAGSYSVYFEGYEYERGQYTYSGGSYSSYYNQSSSFQFYDVNNSGIIVGGDLSGRGWIKNGDTLTQLNLQGPDNGSYYGDSAMGINDNGVISGTYTSNHMTYYSNYGFIRTGDSVSYIQYHDDSLNRDINTAFFGINNFGQVVGSSNDYPNSDLFVSFMYDNGNFSVIQFPGASATQVTDINDLGTVVGLYNDGTGSWHGFTANLVPIPGAVWLLGTGLLGLAGWRRFR